jgi:hypothetical protein
MSGHPGIRRHASNNPGRLGKDYPLMASIASALRLTNACGSAAAKKAWRKDSGRHVR